MEKKNYVTPNTVKVKIRQSSLICSTIASVSGNADLKYVGAGDEEVRSRSFDAWDDGE
jgi:hypothetical protein